MINDKKKYAAVIREYDEENNVITEAYYDVDGEPVEVSGTHKLVRKYNAQKKVELEQRYNSSGTLLLGGQNYATVVRHYDEQGRVIGERYYGIDGQPKAIEDCEVEAVFIFKLDRLSRKQRDTMAIIEDIMQVNDIDLVSLHETLDTSTPWGRAMIGILSSFNQMESENIQMRTQMGRDAKLKKGGYAGGKPPIGYKAVDGELVVVPEEAEIVRMVFQLRKEGGTLVGIADELNRRGYRTKKGYEFKHSAIQNILNNEETYRGHYRYGVGSFTENQHEPILQDDE